MNLRITGNLTWDKIYRDGEVIMERAGGIANITRHLDLPFTLSPTDVTMAEIHVDDDKSPCSLVHKRYVHNHNSSRDGEWEHISYLDCIELEPLSFRFNKARVISADLCRNEHSDKDLGKLLNLLGYVDYLIISKNELDSLRIGLNGLGEICKAVIVRDKNQVWLRRDGRLHGFPNTSISVTNPVGAGDAFVAEFLNCVVPVTGLHDDPDIVKSVINKCVMAAIDHLKEQNGITEV